MTRRTRLALAAVAIAAGAGCILLGRATLRERASISRADAALSAPALPAPVARSGGLAGLLLSTGDDRAARATASDYVHARVQTALAPAVRDRARVESELTPLALSGPAARRSWAGTLFAVLELDQARLDRRAATQHVEKSVAALQTAVAADPANEDAERDLELLLTLQQQGKRHGNGKDNAGQKPQQRPSHGRAHGPTEAESSPPGSGW